MKHNIARVIHAFYAYSVACALGTFANAAVVLLVSATFANPNTLEILNAYFGNNGLYFIGVTLIIGLVLLPFTTNLTLEREITT